jgi:uncharacterized membrane protein YgaE (UPF0421/DUF939 family)
VVKVLSASLRTAIAAAGSLLLARLCKLPESYWAPITTLVIVQSTLGSALTISFQRLIGTAIGAFAGALITTYLHATVLTFGMGIFMIGVICSLLGLGKAAIRFAGITLAIVMLIARSQNHWTIAVHRFIEVSLGILVGLAVTALWPLPDAEDASRQNSDQPSPAPP